MPVLINPQPRVAAAAAGLHSSGGSTSPNLPRRDGATVGLACGEGKGEEKGVNAVCWSLCQAQDATQWPAESFTLSATRLVFLHTVGHNDPLRCTCVGKKKSMKRKGEARWHWTRKCLADVCGNVATCVSQEIFVGPKQNIILHRKPVEGFHKQEGIAETLFFPCIPLGEWRWLTDWLCGRPWSIGTVLSTYIADTACVVFIEVIRPQWPNSSPLVSSFNWLL